MAAFSLFVWFSGPAPCEQRGHNGSAIVISHEVGADDGLLPGVINNVVLESGEVVTEGGFIGIGDRAACRFVRVDERHWMVACRFLAEEFSTVREFIEAARVSREEVEGRLQTSFLLLGSKSCPYRVLSDLDASIWTIGSEARFWAAAELTAWDSNAVETLNRAAPYLQYAFAEALRGFFHLERASTTAGTGLADGQQTSSRGQSNLRPDSIIDWLERVTKPSIDSWDAVRSTPIEPLAKVFLPQPDDGGSSSEIRISMRPQTETWPSMEVYSLDWSGESFFFGNGMFPGPVQFSFLTGSRSGFPVALVRRPLGDQRRLLDFFANGECYMSLVQPFAEGSRDVRLENLKTVLGPAPEKIIEALAIVLASVPESYALPRTFSPIVEGLLPEVVGDDMRVVVVKENQGFEAVAPAVEEAVEQAHRLAAEVLRAGK